jgi:hypothetical protein
MELIMKFKVLHEKFVLDNHDKNYEVCIYFVSEHFVNLETSELSYRCEVHLTNLSNPECFAKFDELSVKDWFIAPNEKHEKIYHVLLKR